MENSLTCIIHFRTLYLDFLSPYRRSSSGNSYALIVLDQYFRFVYLKPLSQMPAKSLVHFLEHQIFNVFGFRNSVDIQWKPIPINLFQRYGVKHVFTSKYSPQSNLLSAILSYITKSQKDWELYICTKLGQHCEMSNMK